ncbi:pyrroline-5-carboxylate reductase [Patiriisocius hiemis]|uniref:Pyrroline-5-carboxylate reductase n=1 Tax=Patiriisocius hiemis TaxID=3075604 RepID=A0ABU2YC21_9FLAO|nr:pyrroline-5-carboxylate reductase [Constantimarinum sp. W242]MDT0555740.1 pyrroline-5-carboxylate reductase [Constantimarinum sp. W242]
MKVLVIGAGNMGLTYAEGMAKSPYLNRRNIMIYDISKEKTQELSKVSYFDIFTKIEDCVPKSDVIFLAVKPYHSEELFTTIKKHINQEQIIVSLMAGITIESIQQGLGVKKVIRTMPNLPAKVGKGVTSFTEAREVTRVELLMIRNLLDTTGEAIHVENENFINASTGISGSGPAYVFYFMQSMLEAALKMGFSENDSKVLVSQTFEGAVTLFNESSLSPESWMERVASKGGTTQAALDSMEDNNVKELIKEAAYAAFNRATELGK